MPNRLLRDWTNSEKIDLLSVHAERFFTRLIMIVDDYGRYHATAKQLKAKMFPLKDNVRDTDILRCLNECQEAGLIAIYENTGKRYLQVLEFKQRLRVKIEKYPRPEDSTLLTDAGQMTDMCQTDDGVKRREEEEKRSEGAPAHFLADSNLYRQPKVPTLAEVIEAFMNAGGTVEMANSFYQKYDGIGWYLNNSPITNFRSLAQKFIANWKGNETTGSGTKQMVM